MTPRTSTTRWRTLNGMRPVSFAADMLDAVEEGVAYEPIGGLTQPDDEQPDYSTDGVT